MTPEELAEIKRLLAEYRGYVAVKRSPQMTHSRRRLETALVRHADALIAAAEVQEVGQERQAA